MGDGQADVSLIAKHFGGGGHRAAAGFRCKIVSIEEILMPYDPVDTVPGAKQNIAQLEAFAVDAGKDALDFPVTISSAVRKMLHDAANKMGLKHESIGTGAERFLRITKDVEKT